MKKIILLLIVLATFYDCSDEVQFNTPALQAHKNYKLWRALYFDAVVNENNQLTINAGNNIEKMIITLSSLEEGTYNLSGRSESRIDFRDADNVLYSTRNIPESSLYPEHGKVTIKKLADHTITGDFNFIVYAEDGLSSIGFNEGVIYKVPVRSGIKQTE